MSGVAEGRGVAALACELSEDLGPAPGAARFLGAAQEMLARVIPCEVVWYTELDFASSGASVFGLSHGEAHAARTASLLSTDLTIRRSFHRPPGVPAWTIGDAAAGGAGSVLVAPRPLLDTLGWIFDASPPEANPLRAQAPKAHLGVFTTDVAAYTRQRATGWGLARVDSGFHAAEVGLAASLQPVLTVLETAYTRHPDHLREPAVDPGTAQALERSCLTDREVEVVRLLCRGLTAVHIGHVLRISPLTVRKHLQNVYAKLGIHDRLLLVDHARRLGLVPATADTRGDD